VIEVEVRSGGSGAEEEEGVSPEDRECKTCRTKVLSFFRPTRCSTSSPVIGSLAVNWANHSVSRSSAGRKLDDSIVGRYIGSEVLSGEPVGLRSRDRGSEMGKETDAVVVLVLLLRLDGSTVVVSEEEVCIGLVDNLNRLEVCAEEVLGSGREIRPATKWAEAMVEVGLEVGNESLRRAGSALGLGVEGACS